MSLDHGTPTGPGPAPKIVKIQVDRDSVAAGDDVDPHAMTVDVPFERPLADVVAGLLAGHYLASIAGGRATWVLMARGRELAVVAQEWAEPRYLADPATPIGEIGDRLVFRYRQQRDPDRVFAELSRGSSDRSTGEG